MTRNIVLITIDSLRADHCGFMGYNRNTTPTLDRLAQDGMVFTNAVASGVPTIASMTAVMTGSYSLASPEIGFNEAQREQLTRRKTIAEVLSESGYATGALSPNPPASSYFGFDAGFDWFQDFLHEDRGIFERIWSKIFRKSIQGGGISTYLRLMRNLVLREETLRAWEDYYDTILEWRDQVEEPYFLWVLLLDAHHPWIPPQESRRWSSSTDLLRSFQYYWRMLDNDWKPDFTPEERQCLIDLYDDSIRYGDRFLDRLQRDLSADDPIIIAHADHGEEFGEHGWYGHQPHLTENLIHVPLVIANAQESTTVERPVPLHHIAPTVAEMANAPHPFSGSSLLSTSESNRAVSKVFREGSRHMGIRTRQIKYRRNPDRQALHDLRFDPDEQVNVSEKNPNTVALFQELADQHVAGERESRSITNGVKSVIGDGGA